MSRTERELVDIAVIGAGPAGMAAAIRAAEAGVSVALLDEHPDAGGAIWRGLVGATGTRKQTLSREYSDGLTLLEGLNKAALTHKCGATVWEVTRDRVISYSQQGAAKQLAARRIILATGALERPMPFPGWTLPGVLNAGAAQIMLKTSGLTPPGPIVMAGSGPRLYLVAAQLLEAGQAPVAIIDTTPRGNRSRALRYLPMRASAWRTIFRGLKWQLQLRRAGVVVYRGASDLIALGDRMITGIKFQCRGQAFDLSCATFLVHSGVVPNVQLTRAIGLDHVWDEVGQSWHPRTDDMGRTGSEGILVAGDGAGISGAEAAVHSGRLAALAALKELAEISGREISRERKARARYLPIRPFLNALFAPKGEFLSPSDNTIVCRCEEVTAGQIRQLVKQGCHDPNAVKSLCRAGMGPCQGRYCGLTVSLLVAEMQGVSPAKIGYFRLRSPSKPVTLVELASLKPPEVSDGE